LGLAAKTGEIIRTYPDLGPETDVRIPEIRRDLAEKMAAFQSPALSAEYLEIYA
jgi:hypothetical protein